MKTEEIQIPNFLILNRSSEVMHCSSATQSEGSQSPIPKLNPPSETNQIFLWSLALSCTHIQAMWEDGHWDAQTCCDQKEVDKEETQEKW